MKIRTLKFFFVSLFFIHFSFSSFSQDFVKQLDENSIQFNKSGKFRFVFSGTELLKSGDACQLNLKYPISKTADSVSILTINPGLNRPTIITDTFSIQGLNNSVGVLFTNPNNGFSTTATVTNFKWVDATNYKARVTWTSPVNQSTITLDFIKVRQEPSKN